MPPDSYRSSLRLNLDRLASAAAILSGALLLTTVLAFFAPAWWALDLLTHFRAQYVAAAVVLAAALWALRWRRTAILPLAVAVVNSWFVVPLFVSTAQAAIPPPQETLRVLSLNVFGFNKQYEKVLTYIGREKPDVLILLEVTPQWAEALTKLPPDYAYRWVHAGDMRSGIAIFSRRQPTTTQLVDLGATGEPSPLITLQTADGPLSVLGTHLYWPLGHFVSRVRNHQMQSLARIAREHRGALVIAGDLNVTAFSPYFTQMLREGGLRECADGSGFHPTWPARVPFLFLQIDHCLATEAATVHGFHVGDYVGSDHYPIVMDVAARRH